MKNKVTKGTRLTGERREILLAVIRYKYLKRNMSIRAIAADTGRGYGTVHRILSDASLLRSKGGKPRQ
jgi:transposase